MSVKWRESYKKQELLTLGEHMVIPVFLMWSTLLMF